VESGRFDFVIFNQVMEHLPDPASVLSELHRVLRVGGKMIYTGPLYYEEHEIPYDYYRYTQFGLRYLFEANGFLVERLDWLEGYFGTVAYQLGGMARHLPWRPGDLGAGVVVCMLCPLLLIVKAFSLGLSIVFHRLEMHLKYRERGYPKNYVVIVSKPQTNTL
jgi:SAM-dependent methyltransferase